MYIVPDLSERLYGTGKGWYLHRMLHSKFWPLDNWYQLSTHLTSRDEMIIIHIKYTSRRYGEYQMSLWVQYNFSILYQ